MRGELADVSSAQILTASVRMVDEASCWSPAGQRHIECIGGQLRAQVIGERPTHDATAERVQDDRQIQRDSYSLRL